MSLKAFAVVVTFNRPQVLRDCIDHLLVQVPYGLDRIHVVANSQDAGTTSLLSDLSANHTTITYEFHDNVGPAGGFYYGIRKFLEGSWDYVWLMDDDVIVQDNCLMELIRTSSNYVYPKVVTASGKEVVFFGWWGVLIRRDVIEKVGLPLKELFYWAEDTEYLQNRIMRMHKIEPLRCKEAVVHHLHERNQKRPSWYYYYSARNTLYYRTYIAGYTWYRFKRTLYLLPYLLFSILAREDHKSRKMMLLFLGIIHGLSGKTGKLVDPSKNA